MQSRLIDLGGVAVDVLVVHVDNKVLKDVEVGFYDRWILTELLEDWAHFRTKPLHVCHAVILPLPPKADTTSQPVKVRKKHIPLAFSGPSLSTRS